MKEVMIGVDDSNSSAYAVEFTLENLGADSITLVHVRSEVDVEVYYGTPDWLAEVDRNLQQRAERILSRMKSLVEERKVPCKVMTLTGDPREKLVEAVKTSCPTMLVLGNRGYGTVKRVFLGSVSDYAVQHADCPVLIVKLPEGAKKHHG